jgi:hypothetical protein
MQFFSAFSLLSLVSLSLAQGVTLITPIKGQSISAGGTVSVDFGHNSQCYSLCCSVDDVQIEYRILST